MSEPCRFLLEPLPLSATYGEVQEARRNDPARYEDYMKRLLDAAIQAAASSDDCQRDHDEDDVVGWCGGGYYR